MLCKLILPLLILLLVVFLVQTSSEGFGTGAIVQLQSGHVPTEEDIYGEKREIRVCGKKYL